MLPQLAMLGFSSNTVYTTAAAVVLAVVYHYTQTSPVVLQHSKLTLLPTELLQKLSRHVFYPSPLLFNGHLQTVYTGHATAALTDLQPHVRYERQLLPVAALDEHHHDGQIALDTVSNNSNNITATSPTLLILHGLAGGSNELYIKFLVAAVLQQHNNWRVIVMNSRGCGQQQIISPQAYCGAYTHDYSQAVQHLQQQHPHSELMAVAYSLGANILSKYVGITGADCPLAAAVAVSNPWDLNIGSDALHSSYIGREIYSTALTKNLQQLIATHHQQLQHDRRLNWSTITAQQYLRDFDDHFTSLHFNYNNAAAYYTAASSAQFAHNIRVPFLALNALDDPVTAAAAIPVTALSSNPYTLLMTTARGGHSCAWYEGVLELKPWSCRVILEFLEGALEQKQQKKQQQYQQQEQQQKEQKE